MVMAPIFAAALDGLLKLCFLLLGKEESLYDQHEEPDLNSADVWYASFLSR